MAALLIKCGAENTVFYRIAACRMCLKQFCSCVFYSIPQNNFRHSVHNTIKQKGDDFMVEKDTIRLLRECDAGVKMGVSSIDEVLPFVKNEQLEKLLTACKTEHEKLDREIQTLLDRYSDDGKEPNIMAKSMSWMKTNMKLMMEESDATIADLMTDGCNMGVKSLNMYLNQYKAADEVSKDITKRLINLEEKLVTDMRGYL